MSGDARLEDMIRTEANRAMRLGGALGAILGAIIFAVTLALGLVNGALTLRPLFPATIGLFSLIAWLFARRNALHGATATVLFFIASQLPLAYLALGEAVLPFGGGTYFFAPVMGSYFLVIIVSVLLLDANRTRRVGALCAVSYLAAYFIFARPHLQTVASLDPLFQDDLSGVAANGLRAGVLLIAGLLASAICTTARQLIVRVRDEEREKTTISRVFGEYVSPEVKDKLLTELTNLRGERRRVAVLFSDLRGFTTFSEGKEPAVVVERLNQYFDRMVAAISLHGGTVDKFIGDAVMATFGGLIPVDNPSASALDAARAMRQALAELNGEWSKQGISPLDNGIGVHFGDVLQGPIGSSTRKEFTVIGDVVNTASRLESATKELGQAIVVSAAAREQLPDAVRDTLRPLGEIALKGRREPVAVWGISI
jgi:class 3 adenylate cyclase